MSTEESAQGSHFADILPTGQSAPRCPWLVAPVHLAPTELFRLQQELHDVGEQKAAVEREAAELRQALEESQKRVTDLIQHVDSLHQRENALREELLRVHDQLLHRDERLSHTFRELMAQRDALRGRSAALDERLRRIRQSLPGRLYLGLRKVLTLGKK